jgi:hypothetical protein
MVHLYPPSLCLIVAVMCLQYTLLTHQTLTYIISMSCILYLTDRLVVLSLIYKYYKTLVLLLLFKLVLYYTYTVSQTALIYVFPAFAISDSGCDVTYTMILLNGTAIDPNLINLDPTSRTITVYT